MGQQMAHNYWGETHTADNEEMQDPYVSFRPSGWPAQLNHLIVLNKLHMMLYQLSIQWQALPSAQAII